MLVGRGKQFVQEETERIELAAECGIEARSQPCPSHIMPNARKKMTTPN
jgi:hypothetical protein